MADRMTDAVERYEDAEGRRRLARDAWVDAGRPLTLKHNNGAVGAHPLLALLVQSESHAAKLARDVRAAAGGVGAKGGRPRGHAVAPDRLRVIADD